MINKYLYTGVFLIFLSMIPIWIYNIEWYHVIITYLVYWFMTDIILSLFMHRWAAHSLWNPPRWLQKILATLGAAVLQGTPISWAAWHRTHHAYSDTEKDPHSPKYKSIFYIIFLHHYHRADLRKGIDRARDPYFAWLSRYEGYVSLLIGLIFFSILPLQWFLTLWAVPVILLNIVPDLCSNVLCHSDGVVKNRHALWPLMFGETYHKSHHEDMKLSYTKWDPAARIVEYFGWEK